MSNTLLPVIKGYHSLYQRQRWCKSCLSTAVERENQATLLAIRPKIMARYEEVVACLGWLLQTSASVPCHTACNWRNRFLLTLPGWGQKVLLFAIIPVPPSVAEITSVVDEITFSVAKIIFAVTTLFSEWHQFVSDQYQLCSGWDILYRGCDHLFSGQNP